MLEVRGLSAGYGQHKALEGADLHIAKGEIVVILGANGAGKTTLLKAICGICEGKVSGSVLMEGIEILGRPADRIVEEGLALVPEGRGIFGDLTVAENLALGAYSSRARDEEAGNLERVYSLFPKLYERRRQIARTMSGGEQQMVAIGRAMMSNPSILALDEPSLGLSPLLSKELFQSLKAVREAGIGILLVEQNARQSLAVADRGYLLENGHIVHEDSARSLLTDPAVQKAYLGGAKGAAAPHAIPGKASRQAATPAKAPVQPAPAAPRPAAPSASDIAANALAGFEKTRQRPAQSAPVPPAPAPAPAAPKPVPLPAAAAVTAPAPAGTAQKPDLAAMVARAQALADRRAGTEPAREATGAGHLPTRHDNVPPAAKTTPPRSIQPLPDIATPGGDRLQAALKEIEQAAKRAQSARPARKP